MDEFLKDINTLIFKEWIICEKEKNYDVYIEGVEENIIVIKNKYSYSQIIFNRMNIIELCVTNLLTNELEFYLHFQMTTIKHAIELFREMLESIRTISSKPITKVLLTCSGGLTSSYFAQKLTEASKILYKDYKIDAIGYQQLFNVGEQYDIILLAPQISYSHAKVQAILKNQVVVNIPSGIFAKYDVGALFDLINSSLSKKKNVVEKEQEVSLKLNHYGNKKVLCLSIIRNSERIHIVYRLYDEKNRIVIDNEIIKLRMSLQDLFDIIDTIILHYPDISTIGITIPGIINDGYISSTGIKGFEEIDLDKAFHEKYPQQLVISNDVNAVAVGIYASQNKYSSLSFLFQPVSTLSGIGHIVDGKLLKGRSNIAGEAQYLPIMLNKDKNILNKTPEGAIELAAKQVGTIISMLDPEAIYVGCVLIPDMKELRCEIERYIPSKYIPELIKIEYMQEYIVLGQFILCLQKS